MELNHYPRGQKIFEVTKNHESCKDWGKHFFFILSDGWESFNEDVIGGIVQVLVD